VPNRLVCGGFDEALRSIDPVLPKVHTGETNIPQLRSQVDDLFKGTITVQGHTISMLLGKKSKFCDGDCFLQCFSLTTRAEFVKRYCRSIGAGELF
jgi:hypothetical protein